MHPVTQGSALALSLEGPIVPAKVRFLCSLAAAAAMAACRAGQDTLRATCRGTSHDAHARHAAIYLTRIGFCLGVRDIGRWFGRDPASIRHACHRIEDARDSARTDEAFQALESALAIFAGGLGKSFQAFPAGAAQ